MHLLTKIKQQFNISLTLDVLKKNQSIRALATYIREHGSDDYLTMPPYYTNKFYLSLRSSVKRNGMTLFGYFQREETTDNSNEALKRRIQKWTIAADGETQLPHYRDTCLLEISERSQIGKILAHLFVSQDSVLECKFSLDTIEFNLCTPTIAEQLLYAFINNQIGFSASQQTLIQLINELDEDAVPSLLQNSIDQENSVLASCICKPPIFRPV